MLKLCTKSLCKLVTHRLKLSLGCCCLYQLFWKTP